MTPWKLTFFSPFTAAAVSSGLSFALSAERVVVAPEDGLGTEDGVGVGTGVVWREGLRGAIGVVGWRMMRSMVWFRRRCQKVAADVN